MQHKEALLEALENLGWPISYEDVMLLEDEILAALTYMQQASDLQEAVKKETEKSSESHISKSKKVQIGRALFFFSDIALQYVLLQFTSVLISHPFGI